MNKYIDSEKLIVKIEKRQEERQDKRDSASLENEYWPESDFCTRDKEDESIIAIIKSLQQDKDVLELCSQSWWQDRGWIMIPPSVTLKGIESLLETVRRKIKWNEENGIKEQLDMGEVSDGYHTFNELYYYRMLYNAAFFNSLPKDWVHKSKRHHTGEECFGGGWFIVIANLPTGQISNHYELKDWDLFKVPEKEIADEWDGHTPQEAADRLRKYLQQEQPKVDLEKEIEDYWEKICDDEFGELIPRVRETAWFNDIARHFAEWGAIHLTQERRNKI